MRKIGSGKKLNSPPIRHTTKNRIIVFQVQNQASAAGGRQPAAGSWGRAARGRAADRALRHAPAGPFPVRAVAGAHRDATGSGDDGGIRGREGGTAAGGLTPRRGIIYQAVSRQFVSRQLVSRQYLGARFGRLCSLYRGSLNGSWKRILETGLGPIGGGVAQLVRAAES